jgi:Uma2 family endonuclease
MVMPVTLRRYTVDELDDFPADGNRYELLDGVLFVSPSPGLPHQIVATSLAAILRTFLESEPRVFVAAPGVVQVRPGVRMEPDILTGTLPPTGTSWDNVSERWLAVEVSGVGSRMFDREYKRDGYLEVGVREVWLVDLEAERIYVSRLGAAKDIPHDVDLVWQSPGGRELRIDVAALFRGIPTDR